MTESEWLASTDTPAMVDFLAVVGLNGPGWKLPGPTTPSYRKSRLFACACVRQAWSILRYESCRDAAKVAEQYADGLATEDERQRAYEVLPRAGSKDYVASGASLVINLLMPNGFRQETVVGEMLHNAVVECKKCGGTGQEMASPEAFDDPPQHLVTCSFCSGGGVVCAVGEGPCPYPVQSHILRDVFRYPFRPVRLVACNCGACVAPGKQHHNGPCAARRLLTPAVRNLAQAAYSERDEETGCLDSLALQALADALEEAGCPEEVECPECRGSGMVNLGLADAMCRCSEWDTACRVDAFGLEYNAGRGRIPHPILAHLRSPGPHVRGCWALDLVLGKG